MPAMIAWPWLYGSSAQVHSSNFCNRSVTAGRARLSSARRATVSEIRRRAEDRRALPVVLDSPDKAVLGLAQQLEGREGKDAAQPQAGRGGCIDAGANGASRFGTGPTP